ncbi:MAG: DUF4389 domain-containing protein [Alphaproteobacteria bacterium]|nr:DUF4389 domain-containing protein [Alphaproteobacteria bacterium]
MAEQISDGTASDAKTSHYKDRKTWIRGLFMLLFVAIYNVAAVLIGAVAVLQFAWKLVTGEPNPRLTSFGEDLSRYFYQILRFQTFNTETKPFPFEEWPSHPPATESG